jgi:rubrerythrin
MKFQCKHCNYVTEKKEMPQRCPYCGEADSMMKAKQAQDILDEVSGEDYG